MKVKFKLKGVRSQWTFSRNLKRANQRDRQTPVSSARLRCAEIRAERVREFAGPPSSSRPAPAERPGPSQVEEQLREPDHCGPPSYWPAGANKWKQQQVGAPRATGRRSAQIRRTQKSLGASGPREAIQMRTVSRCKRKQANPQRRKNGECLSPSLCLSLQMSSRQVVVRGGCKGRRGPAGAATCCCGRCGDFLSPASGSRRSAHRPALTWPATSVSSSKLARQWPTRPATGSLKVFLLLAD